MKFCLKILIPFLILGLSPLQAQRFVKASGGIAELPDNSETREALREVIFAPTSESLSAPPKVLVQHGNGNRVSFRVEEQGDAFYLLFLNERDLSFPLASRGTYIIKRDRKTGSFVQIKIFFKDDPGCFVRVYQMDRRSKMDVYLFNAPVYRDITIPSAFSNMLTEPFSSLMQLTASSVDWPLLMPEADIAGLYSVRSMADAVRSGLPGLKDAEDGAMDKNGAYVSIASLQPMEDGGLNCSGFAKWIVDGIYFAKKGAYIDIEDLKQRHRELRGNRWSDPYEQVRDPYFGLDWTRNLAISILELSGKNYPKEAADVKSSSFSRYVEDVGFPVSDLPKVLYELSVKKPGYFFLGSVNREFGIKPVLRQHTHVAAFFPYLTPDGNFSVAVMERTKETSLASLEERYPHTFVHLVAVEVPAFYFPPASEKPGFLRR